MEPITGGKCLVAELDKRRYVLDAGVADQDIEAPEGFDRLHQLLSTCTLAGNHFLSTDRSRTPLLDFAVIKIRGPLLLPRGRTALSLPTPLAASVISATLSRSRPPAPHRVGSMRYHCKSSWFLPFRWRG
ncbi:hypothetical protein MESS4_50052 [Mesorhizobium sp. STM 4661]|nr:hypothetical protein MESS4_50052 [Mesorhizobium sp. STM 4661]